MKRRVRTDIQPLQKRQWWIQVAGWQKSLTKYFFDHSLHITRFGHRGKHLYELFKAWHFCQISILLKWKVTVNLKHILLKRVSLRWRALDFHLLPKHKEMENREWRKIVSDPFLLADFSAPAWQKLSELKAGWEKTVCAVVKGADNNQLIFTAWLVATSQEFTSNQPSSPVALTNRPG